MEILMLKKGKKKEVKMRPNLMPDRAREARCLYCNIKAKLVSGKRVYPHRQDLRERLFWLCEKCGAYVGCHKNTNKPLGRLANKELREAKMKVHAYFDPLWRKEKRMTRKEAYHWLAVILNISYDKCHIGMFDIEMCDKALKELDQYYREKYKK